MLLRTKGQYKFKFNDFNPVEYFKMLLGTKVHIAEKSTSGDRDSSCQMDLCQIDIKYQIQGLFS